MHSHIWEGMGLRNRKLKSREHWYKAEEREPRREKPDVEKGKKKEG